ncbi:IQ and ubiquitin-like domain-containing protein isoform X1 [Crotalus tigris]|uniref:IQ and ubiquitin-like domain-containing protein isoform X1 n=1 Tax=Crotalus tigris TaxID=88082 RepID=UPI00192F825D|nr:IQ and ubiquitin-like domain-containing protein isoform X1 [Crotalus tigris]XP_039184210.1 IQ and ubiquitin-like domain-containing protein isoform X1 [Crotalus tigris]XP_039184211.1 IQ and ubiquitin-like domain-containing protein isoform X1 [Crotalus tigris]XP_039184213.1 IQ and ubiquitin-like domain-containing protein isoform X1 [Crotalus tigris]XP_039184214.1 IQ and ubiquitin-like domain-containing protein isoform X1 [Crotalus tigris]XP_039184215.1 IQ and ubiquitin-like domain-containing 
MEDTSTEKQTEEITDVIDSNKEQTDTVPLNETGLSAKQEYNIDSVTQELGIADEPMQEQDGAIEQELDAFENLNISQEPVQDADIAEELLQRIDQTTAKEPDREEKLVEDVAAAEELALELDSAETELDATLQDFPKDFGHEIKPTRIETDASTSESTGASEGVSEQYPVLAAVVPEDINMANLAAQLTEMIKNAIVTVKFMLHPDIQIFTKTFNINQNVEQIKQYFAKRLKIPLDVLQIRLLERIVENYETLWNLGVQPNGTIQFDMYSVDDENFPLKAYKLLQEYYMPDVITVQVQTEPDTFQDVCIEIKRPTFEKPFLGGFRHKETGTEYHNAGSQTDPKKRLDKEYEEFCRSTQTVVERKKLQQTINTTSTQMTKIGVYVSNVTDKLIEPKPYVTAEEYHARRLKAIIVIQTYYRRWLAIQWVNKLKEQLRLRLEWERQEELRKQREREEKLLREYNRRMHPKTKDDFELLYHALELWRKEELEGINSTFTGAERKAALCGLLEKETQLIACIGRHKINAAEENHEKAILFFLEKCAEPKRWKAFDGRTTEMDTQFTLRARELLGIYRSISMKDLPQDERLDVLLALKHTVKEHECKLTQEIVELIDREADLMMRAVKECNLQGLRQRICTLFLQYIKTPLFNPEVARLLKVPADPMKLYHNIYFCLGCKKYLPSTSFAISVSSCTIGRCRLCCKLDNEARKREAFLKYKRMLRNLRESEMKYSDGAKIAFILQLQDLHYMVEHFWDSQSALSAWDDLYDLVMIRWNKWQEWSPWNTILLKEDEAEAHLKLNDLETAYEKVFIHRVRHKQMLARNYFSQFPELAAALHKSDKQTNTEDLSVTKSVTTASSK